MNVNYNFELEKKGGGEFRIEKKFKKKKGSRVSSAKRGRFQKSRKSTSDNHCDDYYIMYLYIEKGSFLLAIWYVIIIVARSRDFLPVHFPVGPAVAESTTMEVTNDTHTHTHKKSLFPLSYPARKRKKKKKMGKKGK